MLNETEETALRGLGELYGLKGVVDGLATIADRRSDRYKADAFPRAAAWAHDAKVLRRTVSRLLTGGRGS